MFWVILSFFLGLLVTLLSLLLIRATKRLLQFDDIFTQIVPALMSYGEDLQRMSSGDVTLVDHPEVLAFHKRNRQALKTIESIVRTVTEVTPPPVKKPLGNPPQVV